MKWEIDISLGSALIISGTLILAMINIWREDRKMLLSRIHKAKIVKCEFCSYIYFISFALTFSRCPTCSSINKIS